jgi:YHS domain-containing protein
MHAARNKIALTQDNQTETPMRHQSDEPSNRDPVCGMELSRMSAVEEATYQGKTYYFCAQTCRKAFEADPKKYVRHHRQHGMKSE